MAIWRTVEPVKRKWCFGGQLHLLTDMTFWKTVEPVELICQFGRQLDLLNGYGALGDR